MSLSAEDAQKRTDNTGTVDRKAHMETTNKDPKTPYTHSVAFEVWTKDWGNIEVVPIDEAMKLEGELTEVREELAKWLNWSGGEYPDDAVGDIISADRNGFITLDDGIVVWNPLRALAFKSPSTASTPEERSKWDGIGMRGLKNGWFEGTPQENGTYLRAFESQYSDEDGELFEFRDGVWSKNGNPWACYGGVWKSVEAIKGGQP